ncbi:hypothetical protein AGLY_003442, partial [Aphis glycines]
NTLEFGSVPISKPFNGSGGVSTLVKRKINLSRSLSITKRQRLLRLSKINNTHDFPIDENSVEPRRVPWRRREMSAFTYDKLIDYKKDSHVIIGSMNLKCNYCHALKWSKEPASFCCSEGKVILEDIANPPVPLKSLLNFSHENSKHFFEMICVYNSAFQMTSFGATEIRHENVMPTFKVQGQVYHLTGFLLPTSTEEQKFLQIYFMGDSENEVKRRLSIAPNTNKQIIYDLQYMLHRNNSYIRSISFGRISIPPILHRFRRLLTPPATVYNIYISIPLAINSTGYYL